MSRWLNARARELRKRMTPEEALLWEHVRNASLGCRVRRQHVLDPFIVDFYVPEHRLVIELDGPWHDAARDRDERRTRVLVSLYRVRVLRFENERVRDDVHGVVASIRQRLAG